MSDRAELSASVRKEGRKVKREGVTGRHIRIRPGSEPKTFLVPMFENIYSISMKYQNEEITLEKYLFT